MPEKKVMNKTNDSNQVKIRGQAKATQRLQKKRKLRYKNKRRFRKQPVNDFMVEFNQMKGGSFTFEGYLAHMNGPKGKLYANLMIHKMRCGFNPSQNMLNVIQNTGHPNYDMVKDYLKNNYFKCESLIRQR
mgnify:CR=1 FL=1